MPVGFFVLIVVLGALILFVTNKHSGTSAIPFVKVNDVIYVYDSTGYKVEELPETYSVIGEVIGNTASASKAQNIIDKAPSLLAELNPMYKEKQETEQRFGKIEKSISGMEELMKKQQEMMENFIKKFEN